MANHTAGPKRRYLPGLRECTVRMYFEEVERAGERQAVVTQVAQQLGIGAESLRNSSRYAEVDRGERRGTTNEDAERIAALEREVGELRRANEILKSASFFFATELDGRRPR